MKRADGLMYGGLAVIVAGVALFDWRLGLIVGGLCLFALGILAALAPEAKE